MKKGTDAATMPEKKTPQSVIADFHGCAVKRGVVARNNIIEAQWKTPTGWRHQKVSTATLPANISVIRFCSAKARKTRIKEKSWKNKAGTDDHG